LLDFKGCYRRKKKTSKDSTEWKLDNQIKNRMLRKFYNYEGAVAIHN